MKDKIKQRAFRYQDFLISLTHEKYNNNNNKDALMHDEGSVMKIYSKQDEGRWTSHIVRKSPYGYYIKRGGQSFNSYIEIPLLSLMIENFQEYKDIMYDEDIMNGIVRL